ncbi:MAG: OmpA family protein, partial [Bacteroidota bacterium]|nr:OmpA family protein [Bacteroidota bacterium]
MKSKSYVRLLAGAALAVLVSCSLGTGKIYGQSDDQRERANREKETEREHESEKDAAEDATVSWPHKLTLGVGGGVDGNFAKGAYALDQNTYENGSGLGPEAHLLLEIPISSHFMIVPRVSYNVISAAFTDGVAAAGAPHLANFAYDVHNLGGELLAKIAINRFHFLVGPSFSAIIKKTYAHGDQTAADNSATELPGNKTGFATLGGGIGYDAPLNTKNSLWLTPELFYSYPLSNLAPDGNSLHTSTLRGSLSLKFDISPEEAPPAPPPPPARPLSVRVTAKGVLPNGQASEEPVLPEKEMTTRTSVPVLPYVFFDENSSALPARYSQSGATGFDEKQLQGKDALEVNHAVLDIVGSRMKQNPDLSVTIIGTNSNTGSERHNLELSKERAMAVKSYLMNTWGISDSRISTDARNLPELPTNPVTPAGIEENRRAEIIDSKTDDPVKLVDQKSEFDGETLIRYETSVINPDNVPVSRWKITLDAAGTPIGTAESGEGAPPSVIPSKIPDASRYENQPIHYTLEVTDVNGKEYTADGTTRLVRSTTKDEQYLEKYAMLSFDFDSSIVNAHAKKMLSLITESINKDALSVKVNGYCDVTGTDEYNQALSERRANSTADALRASARMPADVSVAGHGRQDPKFSNDLPEGRQLNRRVEVEIA